MYNREKATPESSNIASIAYSSAEQVLQVTFKNGGCYKYANVPEDVYDQIESAESVGKFFFACIKGKYEHEKVATEEL